MTAVCLTIAPTTADFNVATPEDKEYFSQKETLYTFIVDRSGSMSGARMMATKEAMKLFLQSLDPEAHFSIISFGSKHEFMMIGGKKIM